MEVKSIGYYSKAAYKGNGSTVQYSAPFPYISKVHVAVTVNNAPVAFSWLNTGTVQLPTAPANGASVVVKRMTPRSTRLVDFADGSYLTERELDLSALQLLYILQEILDEVADTIHYDFSADKYDANGKPITNVGDPITDADVVTLNYYKTVVLPSLMRSVDEAMQKFTGDIRKELANYRVLLEDYRKRLEEATNSLEISVDEAVGRVEGLAGEVEAAAAAADTRIAAAATAAKSGVETASSGAVARIGELTAATNTKVDTFRTDMTAISDRLKAQADALQLAIEAITEAKWGGIGGTLANQTDLTEALNAKENSANKGKADGYAPLDADAKVPAANLPQAFVKGMIIMWGGLLTEIPAGWALCDGKEGRPNLIGKFVRGIRNAAANPGNTGGADTVTLTESNLPAHKHAITGHKHLMITPHTHNINIASSGVPDHTHYAFYNNTRFVTTSVSSLGSWSMSSSSGSYAVPKFAELRTDPDVRAAGAHSHNVSGVTSSAGFEGFTEDSGTLVSDNTGSGYAFSVLPAFYELAYIVKL